MGSKNNCRWGSLGLTCACTQEPSKTLKNCTGLFETIHSTHQRQSNWCSVAIDPKSGSRSPPAPRDDISHQWWACSRDCLAAIHFDARGSDWAALTRSTYATSANLALSPRLFSLSLKASWLDSTPGPVLSFRPYLLELRLRDGQEVAPPWARGTRTRL